MNPVMLNPSPHKRYHGPTFETHHHQSRYPKSRLFGYLPDLPYVISCMNPVVMMMRSSPTSPRLCPSVQAHSIAEDPSQAKLCFFTIILSLSKGPRVWPGTLA